MSDKPHISLLQSRAAEITVSGEGDERKIRASLSSNTPIKRGPFTEILEHTADAIDMSRAAQGLPLTVGHSEAIQTDPRLPVGRLDGITLDSDGKLRGDVVLDHGDSRAEDVGRKLESGFAGLSVSYKILGSPQASRSGEVRITRWMPVAASVVSVPMDASVGVNRSLELEAPMPDENTPEAGVASLADEVRTRSMAGFDAGQADARKAVAEIVAETNTLCRAQPHLEVQLRELSELAVQRGTSVADFRAAALELFGSGTMPLTPQGSGQTEIAKGGEIVSGDDVKVRAFDGMTASLLERTGGNVDAEKNEGNQYRGWSLLDLARECLELDGKSTRGMSNENIARMAIMQGHDQYRAISPGAANYVTSDFPAVTENVITKLVHEGYADAEITWNQWCATREVPDFKQFTIPMLSGHSDLPIVAENAAYTDLTQVDSKEVATLVKHGGLFSLSWEAVVNDDAAMFNDTATSMGAAAARTVDKKPYDLLVANANLNDGNPLFADNIARPGLANDGTSDLGFDGIVNTRTELAYMADNNSNTLGITLRYILVPENLRDRADNLAGSEYLPWTEASPGAQRVNTIRGTFMVISTVRLAKGSFTWYAMGRSGHIGVAFLRGNRQPALMRDEGWNVDAMHWKIRHPSVAYVQDFRAIRREVGTA